MPAKKTGRGANLSLLNKEHPKDKKGDDDIGDLDYVDKPDDSSSSGESTSGEALPLEMAPALPEPEQLPPPELAAEPPAKPKRGRPPGSKRPAQASASNPSHCGRASSSIGGNTSEVWCSQERYANTWSAGAGGAGWVHQ
ncbi:hypothetical protein EMIHUDRAFT_241009 [Emiliania huxleyi CCMP1516]|uniref:Uncharacterized protein n=2 Tax=Emiliania huxleyi TaxID=2903 RepID=A0A0D3JDI1_EMIH1|nr:hypothetical protein EMIHUDRAFT_241009 [Emiliania huxleyi CCMP1516]EOD21566.1 hypothetical protein EMIHUDRAFT_241009 [Emiliania huxleyi CCMP1516]|eukprot:XP_005773995.1 hypothetical protein EMIHUDRAFT_241009 [Emiliania huxleyi CCMP1516]